ncbi:MAG: hypothetical protein ACOZIN_04740 [Myxococcota bacterium]
MVRSGSKLWLGAVTVVMVVAGCDCTPRPPVERSLFCSFITPTDGQQVDTTVDVKVQVNDQDGNLVEIDRAILEVRLAGATDFTPGPQPTLETGVATFAGTQLTPGVNQLRVTAGEVGTVLTCNPRSIAVNVAALGPEILAVEFQGDVNQDGKLNAAELPSFPVVAIVRTQAIADGEEIVIRDAFGAKATNPGIVSGNQATVTLDLLGTQPEATYTLTAEAPNVTGVPSRQVTLEIDQVAPGVSISCPSKNLLGLSDDANTTVEPFQLRVCAQVPSDVSQVSFQLGTQLFPCTGTCIVSGAAVHVFDVQKPGTTTPQLKVTAFDAAGNTGEATQQLTLDFDPPVINVTAPLASGGPYNTFNLTVTAAVTGAEGQQVVFSRETGGTEVSLGVAQVSNGTASIGASFVNGTHRVIGRVVDVAGNPAVDDETGVVVNSTQCSVLFTRPATKPALLTKSDDEVLTTPNDIDYTIRVNSANCPNTAVTLFRDNNLVSAVTTNGSGNAQWLVTVPAGSSTYRVDVSNGVGQPPTSDTVVITADLSTPSITAPRNNERLNVAQDGQRQTPGVQRLLTYSANVPTGGRVAICSNQTPVGATACPDGASGWWELAASAQPSEPAFTFPEGVYEIKPVVVAVGGGTNVGGAVHLIVDSVRPTVTAVSIVGDLNNDRKLNSAELAAIGGAPQLTITTSEEVQSIVVREQGTTTTFNTDTSGTSNRTRTVTLDKNLTTTEQDYSLEIVLSDLNFNANVLGTPTTFDPLDALAKLAPIRIDRQAPACSITAPAKTQLGVADDADSAAGYQLRVGVATSLDVANGVALTLSGAATQTATASASGGSATHDFTVSSTGTLVYNLAATCVDEAGNSTTATPLNNITVDNEVPTCSLTSPSSAGGPYGTFSIATNVTVGGLGTDGLPVRIYSKVGAADEQQVGTLTVSGGTASGQVTYPNGTQTVRAEAEDLAGNRCTSSQANVVVNGVGCSLTVSKPQTNGFVNKADDTNSATTTTAEFSVTGNSSNCNSGQVVKVYRLGPRTEIGSSTVGATGAFAVPIALVEGTHQLEVEIDNGAGVLNSDFPSNVTVDVTDPTVGTVTPTGASLFFVASTNANLGINSAYVADGTPGAPADFNAVVNDVANAVGGTVQVTYGGTVVGGPASVTTSPQSFTIPVTLTHNTSNTFVIEVRDQAGNLVRPTNAAAQVDVVAPAPPSVTQTVTNARRGLVGLTWSPVYDDGNDSSSGAHAGYDLRWTTNALKDATGGETAGMTAADYLDSTKVQTESLIAWSSSSTSYTLTMPPLATYFIAVRAKDEVGNYSAFVAPTALNNRGTQHTFTNPMATANQSYGSTLAAGGSLNNDAMDDLVVAASNAAPAGAVYVYFGGALVSQTTCTAPACQKIEPYDAAAAGAGSSFGADVSVGNVGAVGTENKPDLVVGASGFNSSQGRVFIFYGTASATTMDSANSYVELRGNAGSSFGIAARVIPDLNNDGLSEIAIAAPGESSNRGKVYIFNGRAMSAWTTVQDPITMRPYVPVASANYVIEGPLPAVSGGNQFGRERGGYAALGDLTGDGVPDFTVPDSKGTVNKLFLFSGAAVTAKPAPLTLTTGVSPTAAEEQLQTLSFGSTGAATRLSFGTSAVGNLNVLGGAAKDLVIAHANDATVHIFTDGISTGFPSTPALTIQGTIPYPFGRWVVAGDFNLDGNNDIAVGEGAATGSSAWVFYNRGGSFDTSAGRGFWTSRVFGGSGATSMGTGLVTGDFDGDTRVDLAFADSITSTGQVIVWHP